MDALLQDDNTSPNPEIHFVSEDVKPNAAGIADYKRHAENSVTTFQIFLHQAWVH